MAHLSLRSLQEIPGADEAAIVACGRALLEGVAREDERGFWKRLRFYQTTTFLRLALVYSVRPRWRHLPPDLLGDLFVASKVELMEPQDDEVLIGTVSDQRGNADEFLLLGQPVRVSEKTAWEDLEPGTARGSRVRVEGHYHRRDKFSAREISTHGPGQDRIGGRIDTIRPTDRGYEVQIMRFTVLLPSGLRVEHQTTLWETLPLAPARTPATIAIEEDEDDLFGDGYRLGKHAWLTAQLEVRSTSEQNFDLDDEDPEDRIDDEGSARLRLEWSPNEQILGRAEIRSRFRYRDDEEDGTSTEDSTQVGEAFIYLRQPFGAGFDVQVGRQDFDESREWLYDQNLDGFRLLGDWPSVRAELSITTSLSDASPRDENATNYIVYVSNGDLRRHLAGYVIHREFDLAVRDRTTHAGFRVLGRWLPQQKSWLDVAYFQGTLANSDVEGWGLDLGTTWTPDFAAPYSFTFGYAFGSGDSGTDNGEDRTFRQTGLQDNNGKFDGVTSFRYYGELVEPELANLHIFTAGFGTYLANRTSLDLVLHHYRQVEARDRIVDSELDDRPDGVDPKLGWELDAILGWRQRQELDLEVVGAYFLPGDAFPRAEDAFLGKVQLRYRF